MDPQARVWAQLKDVLDPETGVSLVELGVVRRVETEAELVRIALDRSHPLAKHFQTEAEAAGRDALPGWKIVVELAA